MTGRGLTIRDALREYAEAKAGKLEQFNHDLEKIEVILSSEGDEKQVEMIAVPRRGQSFIASATHEDPMAAVDLVLDKMSQQLRRTKEKSEDKRKRSERVPAPPLPSDEVVDEKLGTYQDAVQEFSDNLGKE
ncbi:MAG: ribosome-associated translation inhibitor RaiA [Planctomycetes bacterium]|nr:ribosome-associated translation inhibitor RaiA [Planctomycetota bacterium]